MELYWQIKAQNGPVKGQKTHEPVKKAPVIAEKEYELPDIVHLSLPATPGEHVCCLFGVFFQPRPLQPLEAQKPFTQTGAEVTLKAEPHLTSSASSFVSSPIFVRVACC